MSTTYRTKHPIITRSDSCAVALDASVHMTPGDPEFTPLAGQWTLNVVVSVNGNEAGFDLVENMLRSFLEGQVAKEAGEQLSSWEQKPSGFVLRFDPGLIESGSAADGIVAKRRRYVQQVEVDLAVIHSDLSIENVFAEVCRLGDYAFGAWWDYLRELAPAVFTERYTFVTAIKPFLRPLQLSLGLTDSTDLEKAAEAMLHPPTPVRARKNKRVLRQTAERMFAPALMSGEWSYSGRFFGSLKYHPRDFVVVSADDEELCTHTPIFLEDCIQRKRRKAIAKSSQYAVSSQYSPHSSQRLPDLSQSQSQSYGYSQLYSQQYSQPQDSWLAPSQSLFLNP